ncbi:MAG: hypothetical protein ACKVVT_11770 [Dehalococcoidia bacterium]
MDPNVVVSRLVRLIRLDTSVFDEVRDDDRELLPALVVAAAACLLAGIGAWLYWQLIPSSTPDDAFLNTVIFGTIFLVALYAVAILVTYVVMVQLFRIQADLMALIRVLGYAAWPLGLSVLMFIPVIYPVFALIPLCLLLVTMIFGAQSVAGGGDSRESVLASLAGLAVMVLVLGLIGQSSDGFIPMGAGVFGVLIDLS